MTDLVGINKKCAELIDLPQLPGYSSSLAGVINISRALMISCRNTKHEIEALEIIQLNLGERRNNEDSNRMGLIDMVTARLKLLRSRYQDD